MSDCVQLGRLIDLFFFSLFIFNMCSIVLWNEENTFGASFKGENNLVLFHFLFCFLCVFTFLLFFRYWIYCRCTFLVTAFVFLVTQSRYFVIMQVHQYSCCIGTTKTTTNTTVVYISLMSNYSVLSACQQYHRHM